MKQKTRILVLWVLSGLLLTGCGINNSPGTVTENFWQAVVAGDIEAAKQLATEGSMDGVSIPDDREVKNLRFGDVREEGDFALVATEFDSESLDDTIAMSFDTVLEQEQGQWRVNFNRTIQSMLSSSLRQLQDALSGSMNEARKSIGNAMDEAMTDAVEELSGALQGAAEDMQKAAAELRDSMEGQDENQ